MTEPQQKPPHVYDAIGLMTAKVAAVGIGKDRKNADQKYNFRGIDDVRNVLAPLMDECKLVILPMMKGREERERTTKSGGFALQVVVHIDFHFVSRVDGSEVVREHIKAVEDTYAATLRQSMQAQDAAWEAIGRLMAETGEVEVVLPDVHHDYKVAFSVPPEVVDVPDPDAVPDEFCKLQRTPKKKELLAHLKALRDAGEALPNWATIRRNPPKLTYRLVKKGER